MFSVPGFDKFTKSLKSNQEDSVVSHGFLLNTCASSVLQFFCCLVTHAIPLSISSGLLNRIGHASKFKMIRLEDNSWHFAGHDESRYQKLENENLYFSKNKIFLSSFPSNFASGIVALDFLVDKP